MHERASRLSRALVNAQVRLQDRVVYLGKNRPEFFEVLIGTSMAGAVPAALN